MQPRILIIKRKPLRPSDPDITVTYQPAIQMAKEAGLKNYYVYVRDDRVVIEEQLTGNGKKSEMDGTTG